MTFELEQQWMVTLSQADELIAVGAVRRNI